MSAPSFILSHPRVGRKRLTARERLFSNCFLEGSIRIRIVIQRDWNWPTTARNDMRTLTVAGVMELYEEALRDKDDPRMDFISLYFSSKRPDWVVWFWEDYEDLIGSDMEGDAAFLGDQQGVAFFQHQHANLHH